ncbi:uncharacterized protein ARMOST_21852 [Armillaria ostoyae]|uniref:Uncharacterized protein n=1 Tax=Armillaria ostoyae TaxID=47428 RepID=A0A284SB74_ARMOS|nr:uncharacterized protein ARMOST_21852 [Armillaria ostoyae]
MNPNTKGGRCHGVGANQKRLADDSALLSPPNTASILCSKFLHAKLKRSSVPVATELSTEVYIEMYD